MNVPSSVYKLSIAGLIVAFSVNSVSASLSYDSFIALLVGLGLALVIYFNENILKFLTVNKNFITQFTTIAAFSFILLILADYLAVGLDFDNKCFGCFSSEYMGISGIVMQKYGTMVAVSVMNAFIFAFLNWLREF